MVLIISGRSLRGNADGNASYLAQRDLNVLRQVGAVGAEQAEIIDRADKIGRGNKNNVGEAREIDQLHDPALHATLFPEEQRALGKVWEHYRVNNAELPAPNVPVINADSFRNVSGNAGVADPEQPIPIADLPRPLQKIARRVQLTIDRDRSPPTVHYADILNASSPNNADKYTTQELEQIKDLQQRFLNEILPRTVTPPRVEVPELGEHRYRLAAEPGIGVELITKSELTMEQYLSKHERSSDVRPGGVTEASHELFFERAQIAINFEVPADHRMVVISAQGEKVHEPGRAVLPPVPGQYIFELYDQQGQKVRDASFTVPDVSVKENLSAAHIGKPVISGGRVMEPELVSHEVKPLMNQPYGVRKFVNGSSHAASWTFVPEGTAKHKGDVAAARETFAWPGGALRDGSYTFVTERSFSGPNFGVLDQKTTLEKYPGPLFSVTINDQKYWLVPDNSSSFGEADLNGRQLFTAVLPGATKKETNGKVSFEPETNTLTIQRFPKAARGPVHWSHVVSETDFT